MVSRELRITGLLRAAAAGVLLLAGGVSHAATAGSVSVTLFQDQLAFQVIGGSGFPQTLSAGSTTVSATADGNSAFLQDANVGTVLSVNPSTSLASALASAGATLIASAESDQGTGAQSFVQRTAEVTFTNSGVLVVTAPFAIVASLDAVGSGYSSLSGVASINAFNSNATENETTAYNAFASLFFDSNSLTNSGTRTGLLAIAVPFANGDKFSFNVSVDTNVDIAPIPLPAAVWLFGAALGGLGLVRRRSA